MHWLDPNSVPTLGDWFRAGGYRTHYRGKWHVSFADLMIPGTHEGLKASDDDGKPMPKPSPPTGRPTGSTPLASPAGSAVNHTVRPSPTVERFAMAFSPNKSWSCSANLPQPETRVRG